MGRISLLGIAIVTAYAGLGLAEAQSSAKRGLTQARVPERDGAVPFLALPLRPCDPRPSPRTTRLSFLQASCAPAGIEIGRPQDRSDRLIAITGDRDQELAVEFLADGATTWHPATVYLGTTVDDWRPCDPAAWNRAAIEGHIPAGSQPCLWNYYFDLPMPVDAATLRLKSAENGKVVLEKSIDLRGAADVFVIDSRNVAQCAGGSLPAPWTLKPGTSKSPAAPSIAVTLHKHTLVTGRHPVYRIEEASAAPLVLAHGLAGWHSIYLGMEPRASLQFSLSNEDIKYPVPEYMTGPDRADGRLLQEFYLTSADLTGQDVCLACGGARYWQDASVRYIRFVPMTDAEVADFQEVRELARSKGRPFAGYV